MPNRHILLTPGPTPLPPEVLKVLSEPISYHRTPQARKVIGEATSMLKEIFQTSADIFTITSSGTGAMEASMVNFLSPGDQIIAAHAGKFGERWVKLANHYGFNVIEVKAEYGHAVKPAEIEKALKDNPNVKAVYTTLCETSTGVNHDIQAIAKLVTKTKAILVVDAISGLLADPVAQDAWGIDVIVTGSQKGLMVPPGLSFFSVSKKAWALYESSKTKKFYLDLKLYQKAMVDSDTPFTPAITLIHALHKALEIIKKKGLAKHLEETARLAHATREAMAALGLQFFAKERLSNVTTAVIVPDGVDGGKLVKTMRDEYGVTIAGGQGEMKGKIFRIAHLGHISESDLTTGIEVLCEVLNQLKFACDAKKAIGAFRSALSNKKTSKISV